MKRFTGLMLFAMLAAVACDKKEAGGESSAASGSAAGVGVKECDDYIAKYEPCLAKMPAVAKPQAEAAFKQMREGWKTAASTPQGKTALATSCKTALDALAANPACK